MTILFLLLFIASLFAVFAESVNVHKDSLTDIVTSDDHVINQQRGSLPLVVIVATILSLFAGYRTDHNDTFAYIQGFMKNIPMYFPAISEIDFSLSSNPGYFIYQVLIKQFVSIDPQHYLLITAFIVNFAFVLFYYKYLSKFSLSIYLFISTGLFVFTMAAMKQTLAMAIGVWAVHFALKKRWALFILLLAVAITIHPYIIFYGFAPLLSRGIWTIKEYMLIIVTAVGVLFFDSFAAFMGDVHGLIGEDLGFEILMGEGVNIFRVFIYAVPPVLAFTYKDKLSALQNPMVDLSVNFSILGFLFMFIAIWGDPILLGRMAIYFDPFSILTLCYIIMHCFSKNDRFIISSLVVLFYGFYFYYQYAIAMPFVYKSVFGTF